MGVSFRFQPSFMAPKFICLMLFFFNLSYDDKKTESVMKIIDHVSSL